MRGNWTIMRARYSVKRAAAILTFLFAFVLVGTSLGALSLFENASAEDLLGIDVDRTFTVGVVDMSISTLNPNTYVTSSEEMVIVSCYSSLLQYDEGGNVIGDLARTWTTDQDGLVWHFDLVDTAYFCDPMEPISKNHQVTAEDVIFTYDSIQDDATSRLHYALPDIISDIYSEGQFSVTIELSHPFAAFQDSLINIPILPKYVWEGEDLTNFDNLPMIGSGPFYYATTGLPDSGIVELRKNPIWHMTEEHGWSIRVDRWLIINELDTSTAWLDVSHGNIDCMLDVPGNVFTSTLPMPEVIGFHQSGGFVYEFNLNQMTDDIREGLGGPFNAGTSNQLLLDSTVKMAIAMSVDKDAFVQEVIDGLGEPADSLIPHANPWHFDYPDPIQFDPLAAREMLMDAGWRYDITGNQASENTVPLCKAGGTDPLSFRFYTLNTAVQWQIGAELILNWCRETGVDLDLTFLSINEMNTVWNSADYDLWLWDWVFDPLGDPSMSILEVLTTEAIGTDSDVFYSDSTYDALYEESLVTMDPVLRAQIIDEMQTMAYEDMGCQCIAYREDLYAFNTQHWENFGDLDSKYMMRPDVSNLWISLSMSPVENAAPHIYVHSDNVVAEVGEEVALFVAATDDDASTVLEYRWFWGDGTSSDWSYSPTASHTYLKNGVYTADIAVREASSSNGYDDHFVTTADLTLAIYDFSNEAPVILSIMYSPLDPDTSNSVMFSADVYDSEGDPLEYSWNFGDGTGAKGLSVTHVFQEASAYLVTLSVTDNMLGIGTRPATCSVLVMIDSNLPPSLSVPDFDPIAPKTETEFHVYASDPDGDQLMFVWDWGDGTSTETYEPFATHSYNRGGTYVINVMVTDLTGLSGHEVRDTGTVYVYSGQSKHGGTK